jgi:prolyl 4-hydroxylase
MSAINLDLKYVKEHAILLPKFLTDDECVNLISMADNKGWEKALIGRIQTYVPSVRNGERSMVDDDMLADSLMKRILPFVSFFKDHISDNPVCLNPRFRFLKYDPGQYFKPHHDGAFKDDNGNVSKVTVQMYLNDGFKGGETVFMDDAKTPVYSYKPCKGDVILFDQNIMHEGAIVKSGQKIAVRTEIMYPLGFMDF